MGDTVMPYTIEPPSESKYTVEPPPPPASFGAGLAAGLADPFYGAAKIGAHMGPEIGEAAFADPAETAARRQTVETAIKQREQKLEASGVNQGWGRTVGHLLSDIGITAPLSVLAGPEMFAPTMAGRIAGGALGGAAGGAASAALDPRTEGVAPIVAGAVTGAAVGGPLGALVKAIGGQSTQEAEDFIRRTYQRAVKPSVAGKQSAPQLERAQDQARQAIDTIVENKPNLTFERNGQVVKGDLPQSLEEAGEAIDQTKHKIFQKYDALAQQSGAAGLPAKQAHDIAFAQRAAAQKEVETAKNALSLAEGWDVYTATPAVRDRMVDEAQQALRAAKVKLGTADRAATVTEANLRKASVDLKPIAAELQKVIDDESLNFHTFKPALKEAQEFIDDLTKKDMISPSVAQDTIQHYNKVLKAFYQNPQYDRAIPAYISSLFVNKLRSGLDDLIERTTAPGYQALKNQYGALKSIEKEVVNRAIVVGRQEAGGGLLGRIADVASAYDVVHGIVNLSPQAFASGLALRGFRAFMQHLRDPNRAVRRMFEVAEEQSGRQPSVMDMVAPSAFRAIPSIGAFSGQGMGSMLEPAR